MNEQSVLLSVAIASLERLLQETTRTDRSRIKANGQFAGSRSRRYLVFAILLPLCGNLPVTCRFRQVFLFLWMKSVQTVTCSAWLFANFASWHKLGSLHSKWQAGYCFVSGRWLLFPFQVMLNALAYEIVVLSISISMIYFTVILLTLYGSLLTLCRFLFRLNLFIFYDFVVIWSRVVCTVSSLLR